MLWLQYNTRMPRKYIFTKIYHWFCFWSLIRSYYALQQSNSFIAIFNHSNLTSLKNSILCFKLCSEICQANLRIIKSLWFPISKERTSFVLQNQIILFAFWNLSRIFGNAKISFVHRNKEMWSFTKYDLFLLKTHQVGMWIWTYFLFGILKGVLIRINFRFSILVRN